MVSKRLFCYLKDGRPVHCYKITNNVGEYVEVLDYGASIHAIVVGDRNGALEDVALGAEPDTLERCTYIGGTIGRCANRIAYGRYTLDGKTYQLEQNKFGHFLHGASGNYANKLFTGEMFPEENRVVMRLYDTGEGGFDCCVYAAFWFSFDDSGMLSLTLEMEGEGATILNPTNHTYFNLSGGSDARDHTLWIDSEYRVSRGEMGLPNGGSISVLNSPADFTKERTIREAMLDRQSGYFTKDTPSYDEFYLLDGRKFRHAATLGYPKNGRVMRVYTDMPCLVLFAGGDRKPETGKNGKTYEGYCAVCLETGFVPNAVNCPQYDSPVFQRGQRLVAHTVYQFSAE